MTRLTTKFSSHLESLTAAAAGELDLRENYKLYNKVYRFYKKEGVQLTGDSETDYTIVMNYLMEDLND
jgi:hypothetical protein